ncbi:unnamed protein product [Ilex paraguariensis]
MPSPKELKRILLIALRCVDREVDKRPKIGDVIHMLEPHDLLLTDLINHTTVYSDDAGVYFEARNFST